MITTKYIGPSNVRGTRIKVSSVKQWHDKRYIMVAWDHSLNEEQNHDRACRIAVDRWQLFDGRYQQHMARVSIDGGYAYGWYRIGSTRLTFNAVDR